MEFQQGVFQIYKATRKIHLGFVGADNAYLNVGDVVEFDGNVLRIGDTSYPAPNLKGAILSEDRWLIPVGEDYEPLAPTVTHRFGMVTEEDKDVGKYSDVREFKPKFNTPAKTSFEVKDTGKQAEADDLSSLLPDAENLGVYYPIPHKSSSDGKTTISKPAQAQPSRRPVATAIAKVAKPASAPAPTSSVESVGFLDD